MKKKHKDLACSLRKKKYEEIFFKILNNIYNKHNCKNLVLAGGCAMNSLANGKILYNSSFKNFYVQPAAHDAGGHYDSFTCTILTIQKNLILKDTSILPYILVLVIRMNK